MPRVPMMAVMAVFFVIMLTCWFSRRPTSSQCCLLWPPVCYCCGYFLIYVTVCHPNFSFSMVCRCIDHTRAHFIRSERLNISLLLGLTFKTFLILPLFRQILAIRILIAIHIFMRCSLYVTLRRGFSPIFNLVQYFCMRAVDLMCVP